MTTPTLDSSTVTGIRNALAPYAFPRALIDQILGSVREDVIYHDATLVDNKQHTKTYPIGHFFHTPDTFSDLDLPAILEQAITLHQKNAHISFQTGLVNLHNKNVPENELNNSAAFDRFERFLDRGFESGLLQFDASILEAWIIGNYNTHIIRCLNRVSQPLKFTPRILAHGIKIALKNNRFWFLQFVFRVHELTTSNDFTFWSLDPKTIGSIFAHVGKLARNKTKMLDYQDILIAGIKHVIIQSDSGTQKSIPIFMDGVEASNLTRSIAFFFTFPSPGHVQTKGEYLLPFLRKILMFNLTKSTDYIPFKYCLRNVLHFSRIDPDKFLALFAKKEDDDLFIDKKDHSTIKPKYKHWLPLITALD